MLCSASGQCHVDRARQGSLGNVRLHQRTGRRSCRRSRREPGLKCRNTRRRCPAILRLRRSRGGRPGYSIRLCGAQVKIAKSIAKLFPHETRKLQRGIERVVMKHYRVGFTLIVHVSNDKAVDGNAVDPRAICFHEEIVVPVSAIGIFLELVQRAGIRNERENVVPAVN